jgi:hypothetical protein
MTGLETTKAVVFATALCVDLEGMLRSAEGIEQPLQVLATEAEITSTKPPHRQRRDVVRDQKQDSGRPDWYEYLQH